MNKIGIVTLNSNNNYGNKLQNYALKRICNEYGFQVDTLWLKEEYNFFKILVKKLMQFKIDYKREMRFEKFTKKYLNRVVFNNNHEDYRFFIAGSDQIWNYNFKGVKKKFDFYFLKFSPKKKNISYAASIGVDSISNDYINKFKDGINNFKYVSVRENEAKKAIESIMDRNDIDVVLDPTMLLSASEWKKIIKKPKKIKSKKFILNYFLGELSDDRKKAIEKFAIENDCIVINILDKNDPYYTCDPSEFLYLEENAFLICTDSFHSSVFAILFDTPFIIFDRYQKGVSAMNSRIDTLLSTFNLENKKYDGKEISTRYLDNDYSSAHEILENRRKESFDFISKALEITDK